MSSATRPKRLHEHIVDVLGARIVRGDYAADAALPVEDALVTQLGVSRTVVREAIKVLAQKNMIEVRTRTGTRVCAALHWNQLDPDILRWRFAGELDTKLVEDVGELRRIIEPAAAELAATRGTPQAVLAIQTAFDVMSADTTIEEHNAADVRFHLGILEAAGNHLLLGMRHSILGAVTFAIGFTNDSKEAGRSSLQLHGDVLRAIQQRNPGAARKAMNVIVDGWVQDSARMIGRSKAAAAPAKDARKTSVKPNPAIKRTAKA
jgi:DNA-binding FadR family transcriptional regulator